MTIPLPLPVDLDITMYLIDGISARDIDLVYNVITFSLNTERFAVEVSSVSDGGKTSVAKISPVTPLLAIDGVIEFLITATVNIISIIYLLKLCIIIYVF